MTAIVAVMCLVACPKATSTTTETEASAPVVSASVAPAVAAPPVAGEGALCARAQVRRAYRVHGGTLFVPGADEETIAIEVDKDKLSGFGARIFDDTGTRIDRQYVFARLDDAGKPIDRRADNLSDAKERLAIVLVASKTTTKTVELEMRAGLEGCRTKVTLDDGPSWPAAPEYKVVGWSLEAKRALVVVKVKNLLDHEWPAPDLRGKSALGETLLPSTAADAIVPVDTDGAHVANGKDAEPAFAIEYPIVEDMPTRTAPNGYACKLGEYCDLGPSTWKASAEITQALDKSRALAGDAKRTFARTGS